MKENKNKNKINKLVDAYFENDISKDELEQKLIAYDKNHYNIGERTYTSMITTDINEILELTDIISKEPDNYEAYYRRGNLYASLNQDVHALHDFDNAIKLNPSDSKKYIDRIVYLFYRRTKSYHRNFIERTIEFSGAKSLETYLIAEKVIKDNKKKSKVIKYEGYAKIFDKFPSVSHMLKAYFSEEIGRIDLEELLIISDDYDKEFYPESYNPERNERILFDINQIDKFTEIIEQLPDDYEAYYQRGTTYAKLYKNDLALKDFSKAIDLNPNDVRGFIGRSLVLKGDKRSETLLNDLNKIIELDSTIYETFLKRAKYHYHSGDYEQSAADFSQFIELGGDNKYESCSDADFLRERHEKEEKGMREFFKLAKEVEIEDEQIETEQGIVKVQ